MITLARNDFLQIKKNLIPVLLNTRVLDAHSDHVLNFGDLFYIWILTNFN